MDKSEVVQLIEELEAIRDKFLDYRPEPYTHINTILGYVDVDLQSAIYYAKRLAEELTTHA